MLTMEYIKCTFPTLSFYSCLIFLLLFLPWTMRFHDPSILWVIFLYLIAWTLSKLLFFVSMIVTLLGTTFFKPRNSLKKCVDLRPMKLSKGNSYVAYCQRQINEVDYPRQSARGCALDNVHKF